MLGLTKKIVAITTVLSLAFGMTGPAFGATVEELQAQISTLLATITALQAQLSGLQSGGTGAPTACNGITFDRNLSQGMSGDEVKCLQALLNQDAATQVASSGAGSPGNETGYFGALTKAAVVKFQEKYAADCLAPLGLTVGTGFVGVKTRAKLNTMVTTGGTPPETGTSNTVSLAANTPIATQVAKNAQDVIFTIVKVTAGAAGYTVTNVAVTRGGVSADADITAVKLYDGVTQLGSTQALNTTTHKATFNSLSWQIPANTVKYLTIKGTVAAAPTVGDSVRLSIVLATDIVTSAAVTATFPINGYAMTIAGISVGNLDVDKQTTPATSTNVLSGSVDQEMACWRFPLPQPRALMLIQSKSPRLALPPGMT